MAQVNPYLLLMETAKQRFYFTNLYLVANFHTSENSKTCLQNSRFLMEQEN